MPSIPGGEETLLACEHPEVRRVVRLQSREERDRTGLFFAEGLRFVAQAIEQEADLRTLIYSPELLTHPFGQKLLRQIRQLRVPTLAVEAAAFRRLSQAEVPQGIGIVAGQAWETLRQVRPSGTLCWVCCETIRSPGNLGTIVRTCDAVGAAGLILLGDSIDPYDPAAVRATMGAQFALRFVRATVSELAAWKGRHRCMLVGTSPAAPVDYHAVAYDRPLVLFLGSEQKGMTPEQQALCDRLVGIPMVGRSDSLNVAVAAGILLYEVFNQRRSRSRQGGGRRSASRSA